MQQAELERIDGRTPPAQEGAQLVEQRLARTLQAVGLDDFGFEIAARDETRSRGEGGTRIVRVTERSIEFETHARLETPGKAVARQAQALAHRAHAHRREGLQRAVGPAGDRERQRRETRGQCIRPAQCHLHACPGEPQRSERRGRERKARLEPVGLQAPAHQLTQAPRAAEQPQAAAHLEQHGVGRLEVHAWREVERGGGGRFEHRAFAARIA